MQYKNLPPFILAVILFSGAVTATKAQSCVTCPAPIRAVANANCQAQVTYQMPANCPNVSSSHPSGSFFPLGTTTVTLTNGTNSCSFNVIVEDKTAPIISNPTATPNSLWPPNHKFRDVRVNYTTMDNCPGPISCQLTVTSNEPVNGIGDGNTAPDWIIENANNVKLRAERAGPLSGRVYTIAVTCQDRFGNVSEKTTTVTV